MFFSEEENATFHVFLFVYLDMQSFVFWKASSRHQATRENILSGRSKGFSVVAL